jgi:hypothetical protein
MVERIKIHGVDFAKDHFKDVSFEKFKAMYEFQRPFSDMLPVVREKALKETWEILAPEKIKLKNKE